MQRENPVDKMIGSGAGESRTKTVRDRSSREPSLRVAKRAGSSEAASGSKTGYPPPESGNKCRKFFCIGGLRATRQFYPQSAREYYDYCYL